MQIQEYKKLLKESPLEREFIQLYKMYGLPDPVREYKFCETRKWRFDFCWPGIKIAVELEGGVFSGGRHTRGVGFLADCEKYNYAAWAGWKVFRFNNAQKALEFLRDHVFNA